MERKIGEIFEFGGEWYQCVPNKECNACAFHGDEDKCCMAECTIIDRSDSTSVAFMKLEKVGEPYTTSNDKAVQNYLIEVEVSEYPKDTFILTNYEQRIIAIEINQENMEEKKLNLKPLDLEAAKAGKPVCTRDGRKARIICFDLKGDMCPIVAAVEENNMEVLYHYDTKGLNCYKKSELDLMMLPEKKEGWVNIYNADTTFYYVDGRVFETKDEAVQEAKEEVEKEQREKNEYVDTIKINWEE